MYSYGQGEKIQNVFRHVGKMRPMTFDSPEAQGRRLKSARANMFALAKEGWAHVRKFTDVALSTYVSHENGTRGFDARADAYARAYEVSASWLLWGKESEVPEPIPVKGYVAANGEDHFISDFDGGGADDFINPVIEGAAHALTVSGKSMMPRYRPGDTVILGYQSPSPNRYEGRDVVAQISGSHNLVLKTLKRGKAGGLWTLNSINPSFDPIEDVKLDWVSPVLWVKV